jgi:hypothetical protein
MLDRNTPGLDQGARCRQRVESPAKAIEIEDVEVRAPELDRAVDSGLFWRWPRKEQRYAGTENCSRVQKSCGSSGEICRGYSNYRQASQG